MSTVLVTGAAGFIGRHVVAALNLSHEVIEVPHRWVDEDELRSIVGKAELEAALHLGWYADPRDYLVNVEQNMRSLASSLELLRVLAATGCGHLLVAGTCAEFAGASGPLAEDATVGPWSVYGASKASLRLVLQSSACPSGLSVAWARLFNMTGPGEHPSRLLPSVASALLLGRSVDLTHGLQRRDFLDVRDVAAALIHLSAQRISGDVNVCSGVAVSLKDMLSELARQAGADEGLLRFGAVSPSNRDAAFTVGLPETLSRTGWTPQHDRQQSLQAVLTDARARA